MSVHLGGKPKNHRRAGRLDLGFRWGEFPSLLLVLKSGRFVGAVAKRLVRRVPATAESDRGASSKAICLTLHVDELDFPFDTQRAVIPNYDFGCRHSSSVANSRNVSHNVAKTPRPGETGTGYNDLPRSTEIRARAPVGARWKL
jgi:hypothetical protein